MDNYKGHIDKSSMLLLLGCTHGALRMKTSRQISLIERPDLLVRALRLLPLVSTSSIVPFPERCGKQGSRGYLTVARKIVPPPRMADRAESDHIRA